MYEKIKIFHLELNNHLLRECYLKLNEKEKKNSINFQV